MLRKRPPLAVRLIISRHMLGLTQRELEHKCGFSETTISQYERGSRRPGLRNLRILCHKLDVTADYLLGESE